MRDSEIQRRKCRILGSNRSTEPALRQLLSNLENAEIVNLEKALESRDSYETLCVKYSGTTKDVLFTARCLLFLAFRNIPKVQNFVRLPWCTTTDCINPYHFGISDSATHVQIFEERLTTNNDWAVCRFWSNKTRIGQAFTTKNSYFTVTQKLLSSNSITSESKSAKSFLQKCEFEHKSDMN